MGMFDKLLANLAAKRKTIVFTEGSDSRILEAASKLLENDFLKPLLVGNEAEIKEAFMNDGQAKGETIKLIKQVYSKLRKNKAIEQIANELEESDNIFLISDIVDQIKELSPDLDQDDTVLAQAVFDTLDIANIES